MAEGFPEDKYDFKPTPAQRSFAEQLLHVAGSNDLYTDVAQGMKPTDDESREHYKTKAAVVAYVKKSFADGAAVIKEKGDKGTLETVVAPEGGRTVPLQDLASCQRIAVAMGVCRYESRKRSQLLDGRRLPTMTFFLLP